MNELLIHEGPKFKFLNLTKYHGCANYKEFFSDLLVYVFDDYYELPDYTDDAYTEKQVEILPSIYFISTTSMQFYPKLYVEAAELCDPDQLDWYESKDDFEFSIQEIVDRNAGVPSSPEELEYLDDILTGLNALNICYYHDTYNNDLTANNREREFRVTNIVNSPVKGVW